MVVYAEYLFLENFITGLLLLYFTARLTGFPAKFFRLLFGAVASGLSGFLLFVPMNGLTAVIVRAAAAVLICLISLGNKNLFRKAAVFLVITFLSGGAAMAVFLWLQIPALSGNGVLYLEAMTYLTLAGCGIPAMAVTGWFLRLVKQQRKAEKTAGIVELEVEGKVCRMTAYVDSGNCLRDPISGKPVLLIDRDGEKKLPFRRETYPHRFASIPYRAVGTESGSLEGIRLDRAVYQEREIFGAVLAYYEGSFDGFEVLLNREMIEEGVLDYG